MSRKVMSFSLPEEEANQLNSLITAHHASRSQFMRQLLRSYEDQSRLQAVDIEEDLSSLLKAYWNIKSQPGLDLLVIGLGIIRNQNGEVLIVCRPKDDVVESLSWSFPGSTLSTLDFSSDVAERIRQRAGISITVKNLVSTRLVPDSMLKRTQIIALYFDCQTHENAITLSADYTDYKWVKPLDVFKYFTTSTSDEVTRFLASIQ